MISEGYGLKGKDWRDVPAELKIVLGYDAVSGETVTYTYDSLNRLASAGSGSTWGDSYSYDGFGNLTAKTVTAGSAPTLSVAPDPNTNHLGGEDANGNALGYIYDVENRIIQVGCQSCGGIQYAYDAQNRRIFSWTGTLDLLNKRNAYTLYYYTPGGAEAGGVPDQYSADQHADDLQHAHDQRPLLRRQALGAAGPLELRGRFLSIRRSQGQQQPAGHLELRDLLARLGQRARLREQPLLLQRLWPLHDARSLHVE